MDQMDNSMEMLIMNLIVDAGSARSYAMNAIVLARGDKIEEARAALAKSGEEMGRAHKAQTDLIQSEAKGNKTDMSLFMVHAQDHIMNAMVVKDLASEFVELYDKLHKNEAMSK